MRANASTTLLGRAALLVPYSPGHVELYHSWMEDQELREATASERLTLQEEREMQRSWAEDDASALLFFPFSPPPLFFFLLSLSLSLGFGGQELTRNERNQKHQNKKNRADFHRLRRDEAGEAPRRGRQPLFPGALPEPLFPWEEEERRERERRAKRERRWQRKGGRGHSRSSLLLLSLPP